MNPVSISPAKLSQLLEPGVCQVFLMASPIPYPFSFAVHAWFVTHVNDELHRYEFGKFKASPHPGGIGLLKDFFKPTTGMNRLPIWPKWRFPSKLFGMISGGADSEAGRLAQFLEEDSCYYPHKHRYRYLGPNSNTYMGWVLGHFPHCGLELPATAIGQRYFAQRITLTKKKQKRFVNLSDI